MPSTQLRLLKQSKKEQKEVLRDLPELQTSMRIFPFFWKIIKPLRSWMFGTFLFIICAESVALAQTYLAKVMVDTVSAAAASPQAYLQPVTILVIIIASGGFLESIFWRLSSFCASHYAVMLEGRIEVALFHYIAQHNPGYFYDHFAGALSTKVKNVSLGYFNLLDALHWTLIGAVTQLFGAFIMLWLLSPLLTIIALVWSAIFMGIYRMRGTTTRTYSKYRAEQYSSKNGRLVDTISNMLTITLFARRKQEEEDLGTFAYDASDSGRASWRFGEMTNMMTYALSMVMRLLMLLWVVNLWVQGAATAGDISLVLIFTLTISIGLRNVGRVVNRLYEAFGSIQEGLDTLLVPHGIMDAPDAKSLEVKSGKIDFDKVSFAYPGRDAVLENFSLHIKAGEKVGLVGRSGAGKTTLMSLLLRFYDVEKGAIIIDGQNLQNVGQDSLREQVAMVPQEPLLFHRTIMENIQYGDTDAPDEAVYQAARQALAHDFILALPEGYDTKVGERGVKLSGGQRQRIAIARAILKNAPILVLDEATASLDSESELAISEALHNLVKDKTVIAIAHRLSTLREMTRIVVMNECKIVEDGTHDALLAQGGLYAGLWQTQAGGFLQE